MAFTAIEKYLEKRIGLSADSIGSDIISKAVRLRMKDCGLQDAGEYLIRLRNSRKEWEIFIEEIVIPETWFFRNSESYVYLQQYLKNEWGKKNKGKTLRVLSVPCSTGEEPYSIAMALTNLGIDRSKIHIDAVDISTESVLKARSASYGARSFRGSEISFRDRFFDSQGDVYVLKNSVKHMVNFHRGNLFRQAFVEEREPYDILFCRNLLIYLSREAKKKALRVIEKLLTEEGILFLGHAERQAALEEGFVGINRPGVFACRKERRKELEEKKKNAEAASFPRQRMFEKAAKTDFVGNVVPSCFSTEPTKGVLETKTVEHENPEEQIDLFDGAQRLADQGALQSALKLCSDFLKQNPAHVRAHFLMGLLFEALDDVDKSENCFNKALYLDPKHSDALSHLAFIMEQKGEKSRALSLRKRALKIHGEA